VFFTNYESRKGRELETNPHAALLFHWAPMGLQVRIEGAVSRIAAAESDAYFASRARESRLASAASPQSREVPDREFLEQRFRELAERFPGERVPRPEHWGGYRLEPDAFEFWRAGEFRFHDRVRYEREPSGGFLAARLGP
jgi:pyridoxamine 5'-phosphate oxidase